MARNRDDHVKNFAFILSPDGEWRFAPAYDLTFATGPGGEHTMTVAGEGRAPDIDHVTRVADDAGISAKQAHGIIDEVSSAVADWPRFASAAEISNKLSRRIRAEFRSL